MISLLIVLCTCVSLHAADLLTEGQEAFKHKNALHAKRCFNSLIQKNPQDKNALYWLALTHYYEYNFSQAYHWFRQCIPLDPQNPELIEQYAVVLNDMGFFERARDIFEMLHDYDRSRKRPWIKLPSLYIRNKEWHYAGKFVRPDTVWWHDADIQDKQVLLDLSSEWNGCGDCIQIVRYAKHLHAAGARVTVYVRPELVSLFSLCPYINQVISSNSEKPAYDLTYEMTTDRCMVCMREYMYEPSRDVPYLFSDTHRTNTWKMRIAHDTKYKVGLCWQSTPLLDYFSDTLKPGPKSVTLEQLAPVILQDGIQVYSLQVGQDHAIAQWNTQHPDHTIITYPQFDKSPFMDSASLIPQLDVVISVDTSIAHLAGALGAPVWLLLPYASDFRWFEQTARTSPLYPSMNLFRQPRYGDWASAIREVSHALRDSRSTASSSSL